MSTLPRSVFATMQEAVDFLAAMHMRFHIVPSRNLDRGMAGVHVSIADPYEPHIAGDRPHLLFDLEWPVFKHEMTPKRRSLSGVDLEAWVKSVPISELYERFFSMSPSHQGIAFVRYDFSTGIADVRQCAMADASTWLKTMYTGAGWVGREMIRDIHEAFGAMRVPQGTYGMDAFVFPRPEPEPEPEPEPTPPDPSAPSTYSLLES